MDEKTVESARAEFEKWVKNPHMLGRCHAPGSEDRYEVSETQYAWRAWQAAIAAYRDAEIERLTASLVHWKRLADEACRGEMLALKEKHDLRAKLEAAERDAERYRWLRENRLWLKANLPMLAAQEFDAGIDSAMRDYYAARGGERG